MHHLETDRCAEPVTSETKFVELFLNFSCIFLVNHFLVNTILKMDHQG